MGPGASTYRWQPDRRGIVWPSLIAILFATFAAISFAVDQSVTLAVLADLPIEVEGR